MKLTLTLIAALLLAVFTVPASADIRVTPAGVAPLRFDTAPGSGDWTTLSVGTAATTYTTAPALDAAVSTLNAANITAALATTTSWPPTVSGSARWNDGTGIGALRSLQTRPSANDYLVLMAKLLNATGANITSFTVSYSWGQWHNRPVNESIAGHRAFYSLTGTPGSWQLIPAFSVFDNNSPNQTLTATLNVGTWAPGTKLYLLWADDNGPGSDTDPKEGGYTLDDFTVTNVLPAINHSFLDNGIVKIGADLGKGGAITYLSQSGTTNNIINNYDLGRQIQQSFYSGPQPYDPANNMHPGWPNWPWNPIQTGDVYYNPSLVLTHTNDGQTLYVKCTPKQWALNNVAGQCTFESWITLSGKVVTVKNRLVNFRTDTVQQFPGRDQELPAVYTNGDLFRLVSYNGTAPFTGGAVTTFPNTPPPWLYWRATESWAALLNSSNWGLGVYHPGAVSFIGGFAGTPGSGGTYDSPTGYISPLHQEVIDSTLEYTYTYQLILGTLTEIRDYVYAQPYRPACDFVFDTDREHWRFEQTTDSGWPFVNQRLRVNLNSGDPQMWSPRTAFRAAEAPKLYIRAAFQIANPAGRANGQVFWEANNTGGLSQAQSIIFPVVADGQYHTYELDLAATGNYSGLITQLRFDPAFNGEPGDNMDIKAISSNPFAGNELIAPTLNIARTNGDIVVSFPTITATTAGFIGENLRYDLESTTELTPANWQPVAGITNVLGDGIPKTFTNPPSSALAKFFRLKLRLE